MGADSYRGDMGAKRYPLDAIARKTKPMSGLQRICKMYGRMKIQGVMWFWDYARDIAVLELVADKERYTASEKAKYAIMKQQYEQEKHDTAKSI